MCSRAYHEKTVGLMVGHENTHILPPLIPPDFDEVGPHPLKMVRRINAISAAIEELEKVSTRNPHKLAHTRTRTHPHSSAGLSDVGAGAGAHRAGGVSPPPPRARAKRASSSSRTPRDSDHLITSITRKPRDSNHTIASALTINNPCDNYPRRPSCADVSCARRAKPSDLCVE